MGWLMTLLPPLLISCKKKNQEKLLFLQSYASVSTPINSSFPSLYWAKAQKCHMNGVLCYAAFVLEIQDKCAFFCQDSSFSWETRVALLPQLLLDDPKATLGPRASYCLVVCTQPMFMIIKAHHRVPSCIIPQNKHTWPGEAYETQSHQRDKPPPL